MSTYDTPTKEGIATRQSGFDEFPSVADRSLVFGNAETVDPSGVDRRAERSLTESIYAEEGEHSDGRTYRVHSGSGETYAVDLDASDGPFCQCKDRSDHCKHVLHVIFFEESGNLSIEETDQDESESEPVATDGGTDDVESEVRQTDTLESDARDCLRGKDNCPGPDVDSATIPCPACYTAALGEEVGDQ